MSKIQSITESVWREKYRWGDEQTVDDTITRVVGGVYAKDISSRGVAAAEEAADLMRRRLILPAGRIWAGAGTNKRVTLINCYVSPDIQDSMDTVRELPGLGIMDSLRVAALSLQMGGGIGMDFSTIRPRGAVVKRTSSVSSGVLPFMDMWHHMSNTIMSAGHRRGAMMGTLRVDHPDVRDFVAAKRTPGRLTNFNVSVLVTDDFMAALKNDDGWDLHFSVPRADGRHVSANLTGAANKYVYERIRARDLWDEIIRGTYVHAEPGVIFIDQINKRNNLWYCEDIHCTNPCGEEPLPANSNCDLGHVNLAEMIDDSFTDRAKFRFDLLDRAGGAMVRFLDNVFDVTLFPTNAQREEAFSKRRIGIGYTGLGTALQQMKIRYGSPDAVLMTREITKRLRDAVYAASVELAMERGAFPKFDAEKFLSSAFVKELDHDLRASIKIRGIRNGVLMTIAPTGTTSILAGNVSSGIEPVFLNKYDRKVRGAGGELETTFAVYDLGYLRYCEHHELDPVADHVLPNYMCTVADLTVEDHLATQAAAQRYVDASISKTINVPGSATFEEFRDVYARAYELGLKGCTTYRPDPASGRGEVLSAPKKEVKDKKLDDKVPMRDVAEGRRYRIKWPDVDGAFYVIIDDYVDAAGTRRPFEIFVVTKSQRHAEWISGLTRMITAIFRREGDVSFVVDELKQVYSYQGGVFADGRHVPSIVAAIGTKIEEHLRWLGLMSGEDAVVSDEKITPALPRAETCDRCGAPAVVHEEGCKTCKNCGKSDCG